MGLTMSDCGNCGWNEIQGNDWDDVLIIILTFPFSKVLLYGLFFFFFPIAKIDRKRLSCSGFCKGNCGKTYLKLEELR